MPSRACFFIPSTPAVSGWTIAVSQHSQFVEEQLVTRHVDESIKELEYRLVIRLGGMIIVAIGVVATLVKIL